MEIIGYTAPRYLAGRVDRRGGFALPLFGSIAEPLVISGKGVVEAFCPVAVSPEAIQPVPVGSLARTVNVGDPIVFAFEAMNGEIRFGTAEDIGNFIRQHFSTFDALPFTQTEMAQFLGDPVLWEQSMQRCVALLDSERSGSGHRFAVNNPYRPRA